MEQDRLWAGLGEFGCAYVSCCKRKPRSDGVTAGSALGRTKTALLLWWEGSLSSEQQATSINLRAEKSDLTVD